MSAPALSFGADTVPVPIDAAEGRKVCDRLLADFWRQLSVAVANKGDGAADLGPQIHGHMMAALCMAAACDDACVTDGAAAGLVDAANRWLAKYQLARTAAEGRPC